MNLSAHGCGMPALTNGKFSILPHQLQTLAFVETTHLTSQQPSMSKLCRAMMVKWGQHWLLIGDRAILCWSLTQMTPLNQICQLELFQEWQGCIHVKGELFKLQCDLSQGCGFSIIDGSFKTRHGTAAWIEEGCSLVNWIVGTTFTPREGDDHSVFQSKLCRLLSILVTISHLKLDSNQPKYWIACNGKSALAQIQCTHLVDPKEPHTDLISACQE